MTKWAGIHLAIFITPVLLLVLLTKSILSRHGEMPRYTDDDFFENNADTMKEESLSSSGPRVFSDGGPLPKLLVFDLDYTLWPYWVDTHVTPPLTAMPSNTSVKDRTGSRLTFYPDVPSVLYSAYSKGIPMSLASRTSAPNTAQKLLKLLHVQTPAAADPNDPAPSTDAPVKAWDFFRYRQIYPGDKKTHMRSINKESGIAYEDMVFFDDESRNSNVRSLGVHFHLVPDGVTNEEVDDAIRSWRKGRDSST